MMEEWKLTRIRPDPRNKELFDDLEREDFDALVDSIRDVGQISPIMVTPTGLIICGHQRYRALKKAGVKIVNVVIESVLDSDEKAIDALRIEEQLRRRVLSPAQYVRTIRRWWDLQEFREGAHGNRLIVRQFADQEGYTPGHIYQLKRIADLVPAFMAMYDEKQLPHMMAYHLAQLPAEDQEALIDVVRDQLGALTVAAVRDHRKQVEEHAAEVERLTIERDMLKQQLDAGPIEDARIVEIEERLEDIQREKAREIAKLTRHIEEQDASIETLTAHAQSLEGALAQQQRALSFKANDRIHKWLSHADGVSLVNPVEYANAIKDDPMLHMFVRQHIDAARVIISWVTRYLACLETEAEEPDNVRRLPS